MWSSHSSMCVASKRCIHSLIMIPAKWIERTLDSLQSVFQTIRIRISQSSALFVYDGVILNIQRGSHFQLHQPHLCYAVLHRGMTIYVFRRLQYPSSLIHCRPWEIHTHLDRIDFTTIVTKSNRLIFASMCPICTEWVYYHWNDKVFGIRIFYSILIEYCFSSLVGK
jgi:hypothetical protein